MPSSAFTLFNKKACDVEDIIKLFRDINARPGPNTNYSLLNGALILLVSSWEVYCEDVVRQAAHKIYEKPNLAFNDLPQSTRRELITYAHKSYKGNQDPLDENLALLPDNGWKRLMVNRLGEYIHDFNTPKFRRTKGKNLVELFRHVLSVTISHEICTLLGEKDFCQKLDNIITLRGEIAHTGDAAQENKLNADTLSNYTNAFREAAAAIDVIIHREFRENYGFAPWQITKPIRSRLRKTAVAKLN